MAENKAKFIFEGEDRVSGPAEKVNTSLKKVSKTSKTASASTKQMGSSMANMAKSFAAPIAGAALAGAAIAKVSQVIGKSIELAKIQIQAEAKLTQVLKSTGHAAGYSANQMFTMASGLQKVTTFGDEAIIGAQTLLATFTKVGKETFPKATETILDMSAALGQDLKSSSVQLGKALNDPVAGISALSRVGVAFTDDQKMMIKKFVETNDIASAQKVILDELAVEFGGVAKAMARTDVGKLEQMDNALSDVQEKLGEKLIPAQLWWNELLLDTVVGWGQIGTAFKKLLGIDNTQLTKMERYNSQIDGARDRISIWGDAIEEASKINSEFVYIGDEEPIGIIQAREEMAGFKVELEEAGKSYDKIAGTTLFSSPDDAGGDADKGAAAKARAEKALAAAKARADAIAANEDAAAANLKIWQKEVDGNVKIRQDAATEIEAIDKEIFNLKIQLAELDNQNAEETAARKAEVAAEIANYGKTAAQIEIDTINSTFAEKKALFGEQTSEWIALETERKAQLQEVTDIAEQEKQDRANEVGAYAVDSASKTANLIADDISSRYSKESSDIDKNFDEKKQAVRDGNMSEKQKNKELKKLDDEMLKAKHDVALKQWRMDVAMSIANVGLAIGKTLATMGMPAAIPMIIATAALGTISTAMLLSNKPKMALGGVVPGNSFSGDEVPVSLNSGEIVANRTQQQRILDVMEGRGSVGSTNTGIGSLVVEAPQVTITGTVTSDTLDEIGTMQEEHMENVLEAIYEAQDRGLVDESRINLAPAVA